MAFIYREFWDQPRSIFTTAGDRSFLFDCPFDEQLDTYAGRYNVYLMPNLSPADLSGSWLGLEKRALRLLGTLNIPLSAFDSSRRAQIDLDILEELVSAGLGDAP